MRAVLIGEAWGKHEHEFKHPLVGYTGRELTLECAAAGFMPYMDIRCRKCEKITKFVDSFCEHCREYIWPNEFHLLAHWKKMRDEYGIAVTNVFQERPPENNLGYFFGTEVETPMPGWRPNQKSPGSHVKRQHFHHLERLWRELDEFAPNLIVAMGNAACWATLFQTKITTLRGTLIWSEKANAKVLPTFHPAAVLRQLSMRTTCISDYQKARREIGFPEIRRPERWLTIIEPTEEGIRQGYEWFQRPARAYANDIETKNGQITIVGFARSKDDALVIILRDVDNPAAINYWPNEGLELKAWNLIHYGLQTPQAKIYQNGMYDISHFLRIGLHPRNAIHDTMLWHHSLYPELPKSLGFLGSIYANDINWKQMRRAETLKRDE